MKYIQSDRPLGKRSLLGLSLAVLMLSACGSAENTDDAPNDTFNVAEEASEPPPAAEMVSDAAVAAEDAGGNATSVGIDPGANADVAFQYSYAFTLPIANVAAVQDRHAEACEELGAARCRVIDMVFEQDGDSNVEASLTLAVAHDDARRFGRDALAIVTKAEGRVSTTSINGQSKADELERLADSGKGMKDRLANIERQLAKKDLAPGLRQSLERQAADLRGDIGEVKLDQNAVDKEIAMTPMQFVYEGETGAGSVMRSVWSALAYIVPLGLLAWLLVFAYRKFVAGRRDVAAA